jgi:hypothetical protein
MSDVQTLAACENSCGEIYQFTDAELKALAKLFNKSTVPNGLERLYQYVKNYSYKTMTIAEAENFFR